MKKFALLIAFILLFITFDSNAQIVSKFKAKAGYSTAFEKAEESLDVPELLLVGIGNASTEQLPVDPDFDFETGESMIWIYIFQEKGGTSYKAYVVYKVPIIGLQATEIPFDQLLPMLPIKPEGKIVSDDWIDSDVMITEFKKEDKIKNYLEDNPNPGMYFIGMFNIAENQLLPNNRTYWTITFYDESLPLTCAMDAYTKEVWCEIQLSDFNGFTAKAAFADVKQRAIEEGLENPETLMVMTMKSGIENLPFKNKFDFTNGTSGFWVYLFREKDEAENLKAFVSWQTQSGAYKIQSMSVDLILDMLPVSTISPLENDNWPDSDYMIDVFNQNSYFRDFMQNHPDPWAFEIGIFVNEDNPQMESGQAYWGIAIVDDEETRDSLACVMNIDNDKITCGTIFSDVDEKEITGLTIYPNPARDRIYVDLPQTLSSPLSIYLYDVIGNEIRTKENINAGTVSLNVRELSAGIYIIKVVDPFGVNVRKIIIER